MPTGKKFELKFPAAGVVRRIGYHDSAQLRPPYPSPWAVNCRPEDPLESRLRGGSRPGLTKALADQLGVSIVSVTSVPTVTEDGAIPRLAVVADGALGVVGGGVLSTPVGELLAEDGDTLLTEGNSPLLADTGTIPSEGFTFAHGRSVYTVTSSGTSRAEVVTGVIDALTAEDGTSPSNVTHGCVYRDRLILAGEDNAIYMSRQGDHSDWFYGADVTDLGRPTVFQLSEAGEQGQPCTALCPFKDKSLIAATENSLWVISGDPVVDGTLRCISRGVGIIGPRAWCSIQDARVGDALMRYAMIFLAQDGLYVVAPDGGGLKCISEDRLPLRFQDVTASTVNLVYSLRERGVYIFATDDVGAASWFYDLQRGGFWPMEFASDHTYQAATLHDNDVLLVGADGYARTFSGSTDDGEDIESHLLIGPLRAAQPGTFGQMLSHRSVLDDESGTVTWRIVTGESAEEACENGKLAIEYFQAGDDTYEDYVAASGDWTAGRNGIVYPRTRAEWFVFWLQSTARWGYETIYAQMGQSGVVR